MARKAHSSDVFLTARLEGWSEEVPWRLSSGAEQAVYRKDDRVIRVRTGREGRIEFCDRYRGEDRQQYRYLTTRDPGKADRVIYWMTEPWR